ncbi:MAG: hypothetical protein KF884_03165 [Fimbriimonadaceae bacterium]|nr:hypothetical protein [Fimbriimonadaceae bacterium]QYK59095.1 MAG: hypothetical protein KF884_03165 [Fimbriimonadaceae bacterium]
MFATLLPFALLAGASDWILVESWQRWDNPQKYHRTTVINPGPGTLHVGRYPDTDQLDQSVVGSAVQAPPNWAMWLRSLSEKTVEVTETIPAYTLLPLEELWVEAHWNLHRGYEIWQKAGDTPQSARRDRSWHTNGRIVHWKQRGNPE